MCLDRDWGFVAENHIMGRQFAMFNGCWLNGLHVVIPGGQITPPGNIASSVPAHSIGYDPQSPGWQIQTRIFIDLPLVADIATARRRPAETAFTTHTDSPVDAISLVTSSCTAVCGDSPQLPANSWEKQTGSGRSGATNPIDANSSVPRVHQMLYGPT